MKGIVSIGLLLLAGTAPIALAQTGKPVGKVLLATGDVVLRDGSGTVRSLARGQDVHEHDVIITGANGKAQLRMVDSAVIALRSDTEFSFDTYSFDGDPATGDTALMSMVRGGFRTISGSIGDADSDEYRIDTPMASIGIRGTTHEALLDGMVLYTAVYTGGTTISNNFGSVDTGIGASFDFSETVAGQPPRGLLTVPEVAAGFGLEIAAATTADEADTVAAEPSTSTSAIVAINTVPEVAAVAPAPTVDAVTSVRTLVATGPAVTNVVSTATEPAVNPLLNARAPTNLGQPVDNGETDGSNGTDGGSGVDTGSDAETGGNDGGTDDAGEGEDTGEDDNDTGSDDADGEDNGDDGEDAGEDDGDTGSDDADGGDDSEDGEDTGEDDSDTGSDDADGEDDGEDGEDAGEDDGDTGSDDADDEDDGQDGEDTGEDDGDTGSDDADGEDDGEDGEDDSDTGSDDTGGEDDGEDGEGAGEDDNDTGSEDGAGNDDSEDGEDTGGDDSDTGSDDASGNDDSEDGEDAGEDDSDTGTDDTSGNDDSEDEVDSEEPVDEEDAAEDDEESDSEDRSVETLLDDEVAALTSYWNQDWQPAIDLLGQQLLQHNDVRQLDWALPQAIPLAERTGTVRYGSMAVVNGSDEAGLALQDVSMSFLLDLAVGRISDGRLSVLDAANARWDIRFSGVVDGAEATMDAVDGTLEAVSPATGFIHGIFIGNPQQADFIGGFHLQSGTDMVQGLAVLKE